MAGAALGAACVASAFAADDLPQMRALETCHADVRVLSALVRDLRALRENFENGAARVVAERDLLAAQLKDARARLRVLDPSPTP